MLKKIIAAILIAAVAGMAVAELESDTERLGYSIGYDFGADLRQIDVDMDSLVQAIRDAYEDNEPAVPAQEMQERLMALQEEIRQERMEAFMAMAEENQAAADQFLEENKDRTGVVDLPSGVQYRIIDEGDGDRPSMDDTVTVHYRGSNIDGQEFDSSFARGVPVVFEVNSVLEGWQEVLPLMREGATWQVFLPPELAFGSRGEPPHIGPNEALQFDLRLVKIGVPEDQEVQEGGEMAPDPEAEPAPGAGPGGG